MSVIVEALKDALKDKETYEISRLLKRKTWIDYPSAILICTALLSPIFSSGAYALTQRLTGKTIDIDGTPTTFGWMLHTGVMLTVLLLLIRGSRLDLSDPGLYTPQAMVRNVAVFAALCYVFGNFHSPASYDLVNTAIGSFSSFRTLNEKDKPTAFGVALHTFIAVLALDLGYEFATDCLFFLWNVSAILPDKLLASLGVEGLATRFGNIDPTVSDYVKPVLGAQFMRRRPTGFDDYTWRDWSHFHYNGRIMYPQNYTV